MLDRQKNLPLAGSAHAGVVSSENVRIEFTHASLNGVYVFAVDIINACLQEP